MTFLFLKTSKLFSYSPPRKQEIVCATKTSSTCNTISCNWIINKKKTAENSVAASNDCQILKIFKYFKDVPLIRCVHTCLRGTMINIIMQLKYTNY